MADQETVETKEITQETATATSEPTVDPKDAKLKALEERAKGFDRTTTEYEEGKRVPKWMRELGVDNAEDARKAIEAAKRTSEPAKPAAFNRDDFLDENGDFDPVKYHSYLRDELEKESRQKADALALETEEEAITSAVADKEGVEKTLLESYLRGRVPALTGGKPATAREIAAAVKEFNEARERDRAEYIAALEAKAAENARNEPPAASGGAGGARVPDAGIAEKIEAAPRGQKAAVMQAEIAKLLAAERDAG